LVEHFLGKEEVSGSSPDNGSNLIGQPIFVLSSAVGAPQDVCACTVLASFLPPGRRIPPSEKTNGEREI
jgi:hypothetical protein